MSFGKKFKVPKVGKLDPALLKRIPELVNNIAEEILMGTPPGEAVESEIIDRIKTAVMNEIRPQLEGNKILIKLADKAVEKAINSAWESLKKKFLKGGEEAEEAGIATVATSYQTTTQYQPKQTYTTAPSYKSREGSNNAYGLVALILGILYTFVLLIGYVDPTLGALGIIYLLPLIVIINGIIGTVLDKSKAMAIIGLIFGIILLFLLLILIDPMTF